MPALDAVMNFTFRQIILDTLTGKTTPGLANDMITKVIKDAGVESMLKSWILLDNHDVMRINATLPDRADQKIAQVLQFTLPGSPNLYYGTELGMQGMADPANRAPMRWDLAGPDNEVYNWTRTLIKLRKKQRALKIGDYHKILSNQLIAFERCTEKVNETLLVIVNPTSQTVKENVLVPDSKLMNGTRLVNLLGNDQVFTLNSGIIEISIASKTALVLKPQTDPVDGYSPYKRFA
jgi:maltooligosyltrehalose synthase